MVSDKEKGKYKMILEHAVVLESEHTLKKKRGGSMSQRYRSQPRGAFNGQI